MLSLSPVSAQARKAIILSMTHDQRRARNMRAYDLRLCSDLAKQARRDIAASK